MRASEQPHAAAAVLKQGASQPRASSRKGSVTAAVLTDALGLCTRQCEATPWLAGGRGVVPHDHDQSGYPSRYPSAGEVGAARIYSLSPADANRDRWRSPGAFGPEGSSNELEETQTLQNGVFGVLYTLLGRRHNTSKRVTALRLALEFLQLFTLIVSPRFNWTIAEAHGWVGRVAQHVCLCVQRVRVQHVCAALTAAFLGDHAGHGLRCHGWTSSTPSQRRCAVQAERAG